MNTGQVENDCLDHVFHHWCQDPDFANLILFVGHCRVCGRTGFLLQEWSFSSDWIFDFMMMA